MANKRSHSLVEALQAAGALYGAFPVKRALAGLSHPVVFVKNMRWQLARSVSSRNHIFVFGAGRSGTTLMREVLNVHSRLACPDHETGLFVRRNIEGLQIPGVPPATMERFLHDCRDIVELLDSFADWFLAQTTAVRFVEKTPQHVLRARFLGAHFPNARFVHMIRDPRDAYASLLRRPAAWPRTPGAYARVWRASVLARESSEANPRTMDVKYEDLCTRPEQVIRDTMLFLHEEFEPAQLNPSASSQTSWKKLVGHERLGSEISPATVGCWKTDLSDDQVAEIERVAGTLMTRWGYVPGRGNP